MHQLSYLKLRIMQIRFRLGLCPRRRFGGGWGLTALLRLSGWI